LFDLYLYIYIIKLNKKKKTIFEAFTE
jgi:hypothetical protein